MTVPEALALIGYPHEVPSTLRPVQLHCPFHKGGMETTRSARYYPDTDSLHCFTCKRSWTAVQIVAAHYGVSAKEAARHMGGKPEGQARRKRVEDDVAEVVEAIARRPMAERVALLRAFDPVVQIAAHGEGEGAVRRACRSFAQANLVPTIVRA